MGALCAFIRDHAEVTYYSESGRVVGRGIVPLVSIRARKPFDRPRRH